MRGILTIFLKRPVNILINWLFSHWNITKDFVLPTKKYRKPEKQEIEYLKTLKKPSEMENETDPEKIQTIIYDIGMNSHFDVFEGLVFCFI